MTCKSCPTKLDGILYSQRKLSLDVVQGGDEDNSNRNYLVNTLQLDFCPTPPPPPPPPTPPVYSFIYSGDCPSNGLQYITTYEECGRAGETLGMQVNAAWYANSGYPSGNRQKYCGTWGDKRYLHFNSQTSGRGSNGYSILQQAGSPSWQVCKRSPPPSSSPPPASPAPPLPPGYRPCRRVFDCGNPCTSQTIDLASIHGLVAGDVYTVRLRETNAASVGGEVAVIAASYNTGSLERPFFGLQ